ncbi:transposase [Fusobacterium nucleatum]
MANYVLTLALKTELWQEHILEKRLNIARMIYNSCLSEILKRHRKMINSPEYKEISNLDKKEQSKRYKELDKKYSISKFELNKYVKENLEEVSIEKAQKEFKNFVKLHNEEIERIKKENVKTLKCMGF